MARHDKAGSPDLLWVLMITSGTHRRWLGDVEVSDIAAAGPPAASIVRTAKIATIEAAEAGKLGVLPLSDRPDVRAHLAGLLAAAMGD